MATQIKAKRPQEEEKILYLSREEAVTLIQNLITLLTDPIGGGVTNMMVYPEDLKLIPYRLYLIPRRPEKPVVDRTKAAKAIAKAKRLRQRI